MVSAKAARRKPHHVAVTFLCGCVLALLLMELFLHNFSGKIENSEGFELRNDREGIARAHFSAAGLRLTGNPEIAGAPSLLLLGDSHVEAKQVRDEQTIGSVLERRLRAEGRQWNVLQYGWGGAGGLDYVYAAPVIEAFDPGRIFVLITSGDFDNIATPEARLVERDGHVVAEAVRPGAVHGRQTSFGGVASRKLKESGLFYSVALRFALDILPQFTAHEQEEGAGVAALAPEKNVRLILQGLKEAYGDKLRILYAPGQPYLTEGPLEPQEKAMLTECKAQGVPCRSLRERMLRKLLERHELSRGFPNTEPGAGHLSAEGHEVAAEEMYEWLSASH